MQSADVRHVQRPACPVIPNSGRATAASSELRWQPAWMRRTPATDCVQHYCSGGHISKLTFPYYRATWQEMRDPGSYTAPRVTGGQFVQGAGSAPFTEQGSSDHSAAATSAGGIATLLQRLGDSDAPARQDATAALWDLAISPQRRSAMMAAGVIPQLMRLLKDGTVREQGHAAGLSEQLAIDTDNRDVIARAGTLPLLEGLVAGSDERCQELAAAAVRMLAFNPKTGARWAGATTVAALSGLVTTGTPRARECAAAAVRIAAASCYSAKDAVPAAILTEAVRPLVQQLSDGHSADGKVQAAKELAALTEYAVYREAVMAAGAIPALVRLLRKGTPEAVENQAAATLMFLAMGQERRDTIFQTGAVTSLMRMLRDGQPGGQEVAAGALKCLCASPAAACAIRAAGAKPLLDSLQRHGTAWARVFASEALERMRRHAPS